MKLPKFLEALNPDVFLSPNYLVIDFETTNKTKGSALNPLNELVLWVAYNGTDVFCGDSSHLEELKSLVRKAEFIVAHNAKFELQWLYRLGIKAGTVFAFDTMLAEYVIAGNRKWQLSLNACAARQGLGQKEHIVARMIEGGVCPSEIPQERLLEYCTQDVMLTHAVFHRQLQELEENGLLPVMYTRCLGCICLAEVEANGMTVDLEAVEKEYRKTALESREALARINEITGGINPNSPKQIGEYLYDNLKFDEIRDHRGEPIRTPKNGRKTNEETISLLRPTTEAQRAFIEAYSAYAPLKKRLNTLEKLYECGRAGGNLRFHLNQAVTGTHRLSSSGGEFKVQGQNIDRDLKRVFKARHRGWLVGGADAAQIEFRAAGDLTDDEQIRQDLRDKVDVHRNTASIIFRKNAVDVTKGERTDAKPRTFRPLYGGSSGTSLERKYIKFFRERYKTTYKVQTRWTHEVLASKRLVTKTGLILYWPDVVMYDSGYIKGTTEIFNYPVQSFCGAEIMGVVLFYCWFLLKERGLKTFLTNTIHDSVIFEVHPDEVEEWKEVVREAFTTKVFKYLHKVYGIKLSVPLEVEYEVGERWGEGKEEKFELWGTFDN